MGDVLSVQQVQYKLECRLICANKQPAFLCFCRYVCFVAAVRKLHPLQSSQTAFRWTGSRVTAAGIPVNQLACTRSGLFLLELRLYSFSELQVGTPSGGLEVFLFRFSWFSMLYLWFLPSFLFCASGECGFMMYSPQVGVHWMFLESCGWVCWPGLIRFFILCYSTCSSEGDRKIVLIDIQGVCEL